MLCRTQRLTSLPGLILAVWALASQVAAGSVVLPGDLAARQRAIAKIDALSVLCSPSQLPGGHQAPVPHRAPDCALYPLQAALAAGSLILAQAPALPLPVNERLGRPLSPTTARGPPAPPHATALPRGPPVSA